MTLQIERQPFATGEVRQLAIRDERIAASLLTDGKPPTVEARHDRSESHPTHNARHYDLEIRNPQSAILNITVQLNHGDPADDAARLSRITENLLCEETLHPTDPGPDGWGEEASDESSSETTPSDHAGDVT